MRVLAAVGLALVPVFATGSMAAGSGVTGKWVGEMRQIDVDQEKTYPIALTLQGKKGEASYPTLKCSGAWNRIGEKDGYAVYKETARNATDGGCIDGVMTIMPDGGNLVVGWFGMFEGKPSVATAILTREPK